MSPSQPRVSVVICAYTERRWDDIRAAVESVHRQTCAPEQILLVVDHNSTLEHRLREAVPAAHVVANTHGRGLSGARNTGAQLARGDVVAFLDDDASAAPDWLECLTAAFADPDVFVVGGAAIPVWPQARPTWLPGELDWVVGCSYVGMPDATSRVRNPIGASMAIRREVFDLVGGFVEGIGRIGRVPLGCEETELCIRLANRLPTAQVVYEPKAVVQHRVSDDRVRRSYLWRRCYAEGVSKAAVSRLVGQSSALATERSYVSRVLPSAVVRELTSPRDGGISRAISIVGGLTVTAAGYALGRLRRGVQVAGI